MDTAPPPLPPESSPQAMAAPPINSLPPSVAHDRDLYCLECGYNLRGLAGDPVRCPECGRICPLREIEIPAATIKRRLVRLESASAYSVLFLYAMIGAVSIAVSYYPLFGRGVTPMAPCGEQLAFHRGRSAAYQHPART